MSETTASARILVLIVTYNGMTWIDRCLTALRKSRHSASVLVIDNGSKDGTVGRIRTAYPEVMLQVNEHNLGFGQANNLGFCYALEHVFDYVFMINQDVYVFPDTIDALLQATTEADTAIFTPLQLNGDGSDLDRHFRDCVHYDICPGVLTDALCGRLQTSYQCVMTYAAAWFLPVSTLRTIGGFDPIFFHYGEDVHYVSRVLYHGLTMRIVPASKVCHDRIEAGNMQMYNYRKTLRSFRNSYLDLTRQRSWWRTFPHVRTWLTALQAFGRGNLKAPWETLGAYINIFWHRRELEANRAANRQIGPNWLATDKKI